MKAKRACPHADPECARCRRFRAIDNREAAIAAGQVRNAEYYARYYEARWKGRAALQGRSFR